jgi:hypothetical protein
MALPHEREPHPFRDDDFTPDWPYDGARRYDIIVAMRKGLQAAGPSERFRHEPIPRDADGMIPEAVLERLKKQLAARRAVHASWDLTSRMPSR